MKCYLQVKQFWGSEELRKEVVSVRIVRYTGWRCVTFPLQISDDGFAAHHGAFLDRSFFDDWHHSADCSFELLQGSGLREQRRSREEGL